MHITQKFLAFTLLGADWVLWLLLGLSVLSVGIMIERWRYFANRKVDVDELARDLSAFLASGDLAGAEKKWGQRDAIETVVGLAGLREAARGPDVAAEAMTGERARHRQELERNLTFLGTLGNNAPFIGLFGTVLGIIRAFRDLSLDAQSSGQAVMAGISEALVATAVGLLVALPAVMTFNYFQRRVRAAVASSDAVRHLVLAELRAATATSPGKLGA